MIFVLYIVVNMQYPFITLGEIIAWKHFESTPVLPMSFPVLTPGALLPSVQNSWGEMGEARERLASKE